MVQLNMRLTLLNKLFCLGCILSLCESTASSSNQKDVYNYAIDVWPVDSCPINGSEWQAAAARTGCNGARGYHCVPDKFHSRLIEFCYNKTRILVPEEHCLELAANGILNYVKCHEFTKGCPEKHYFSNEIYKYQSCLSLAFHCFTSDIKCLHQKFKKQQNEIKHPDSTAIDCKGWKPLDTILPFLFIPVVLCVGIFIMFLRINRKKIKKLKTECVFMEQEELGKYIVEKRPAVGTSVTASMTCFLRHSNIISRFAYPYIGHTFQPSFFKR